MNLEALWRDCPYLSDLVAQPSSLAQTLAGLETAKGLEQFAGAAVSPRWRRILFTGMGSSYWGCRPLYVRLLQAGRTPIMVETSELIHYERGWLTPDTLVIAVSQSGLSAEIVRLLDLVDGRCEIIGVTNTPDSPLALRSAATLLMHAGVEFTVACKTYLATLLALEWLGDILAGQPADPVLRAATQFIPHLRAYVDCWPEHVAQLMPLLDGAASLFFAGRGESIAAAETAGLIVKESTHLHGEGMSAAAFRHGPFEMLNNQVLVTVFEGAPATAGLSHRLLADVRAAGGRAALIGPDESGVFRTPSCDERLRPLAEILPVEMITLAASALAQREPGRFERAAKVTVVE